MRERIKAPVVKSIDKGLAMAALEDCPEIIQAYVKSLEELVEAQRQSQIKALAKIKAQSIKIERQESKYDEAVDRIDQIRKRIVEINKIIES